MTFTEMTCGQFFIELASKAPVPGGGGASALVGAAGSALGSMVCNLTVGKKKYASVEEEIKSYLVAADKLREELLTLADRDAEAFEPLSRAYSIPKDAPEREEIMEQALKTACQPPMDIMRTVCKVIDLLSELADKGSTLAISDVGVGAVCCKAALQGASLNVFINISTMKDSEYASVLRQEADGLLEYYCAKSDAIFHKVASRLRKD